jgi:drug/metabolite transporter (DMT)-like permease
MQSKNLPFFILFLPPLFWASNFIAGRSVSHLAAPLNLSFWRWFIALIILLPFIVVPIWKQRQIIQKHFIKILVLAALGIAGFNSLVYIALQDTTATNALLLNSFIPIFIILISSLLLRETITKIQALGVFLSLLGVIAIITKMDYLIIKHLTLNKGDLWMLLAALDWALYSVLLKYFRPKEMSPIAFLGILIFLGVLILLPLHLYNPFNEIAWVWDETMVKVVLYIAIFPSIISYLAWNYGVQKIGAAKGGQFIHLMPFFGAILAVILLNEEIHSYHIIGGLFIATGLWLSLFYKRSNQLLKKGGGAI